MGEATSSPAVRRIAVLGRYNTLSSLRSAPTPTLANSWLELGRDLTSCARQADISHDVEIHERADWFRALARQCYARSNEILTAVRARRPGATQRLPHGWQPTERVIDVAQAEVAS